MRSLRRYSSIVGSISFVPMETRAPPAPGVVTSMIAPCKKDSGKYEVTVWILGMGIAGRAQWLCTMFWGPRFLFRMSLQTLNDIVLALCARPRARVMLQRKVLGWVPISSSELYRNVVGMARALSSWGIGKGDRVAILSENRPEWTITDFAVLSLGAVTVPIYSTQTSEQTAFVPNDSGARLIAVSTQSQLEKVLAIQQQTPVERILVMDPIETVHAVQMPE